MHDFAHPRAGCGWVGGGGGDGGGEGNGGGGIVIKSI